MAAHQCDTAKPDSTAGQDMFRQRLARPAGWPRSFVIVAWAPQALAGWPRDPSGTVPAGVATVLRMLAGVAAKQSARPARRRPRARAAIAVTLAGLTGLSAAGCSQFDKALGQQEEVVIFQSNTSNAVKLRVRAACSHIPQAVVEPLPTDHKLSDEIYDVRYEVGSASTTDLARLQQCLSRFRSVVGLETDTPGGDD